MNFVRRDKEDRIALKKKDPLEFKTEEEKEADRIRLLKLKEREVEDKERMKKERN